MNTKPALGSGARFTGLAATLAAKQNVKNPQALAAAIGRKKYGAAQFNSLTHKKRSSF